ncbi:MAG TPA: hypothetical protein VGG74_11960 [Kofleriaceae bacterium]
MSRLALTLAFGGMLAAGLPSPGLYLALALGIAAIGTGLVAYRRRSSPGIARLGGAAAVAIGTLGCLLGAVRVAIVLAALGHIDRMLP